jgi:hypothetical protein
MHKRATLFRLAVATLLLLAVSAAVLSFPIIAGHRHPTRLAHASPIIDSR